MPIWNAFNGLRIEWFLFMDVSLVEGMETQASANPQIIQDFTRKECLDEEGFKPAPDTSPNSDEKKLRGSYIDDLTEYIGEGYCRTSPDTHRDHNTVKWGSDKCRCNPDQLKAGALSSERRQKRIIENNSSQHIYNQTSEDAEVRNNISSKATPCGSLSEKVSITGIISKYFSDFDDVDSCSVSLFRMLES